MHIEIKDNGLLGNIEPLGSWLSEGFFVATVGETAYGYLSGRIFSLAELSCCSHITVVNVPYSSDYKRFIDDDSEALCRLDNDTQNIATSCSKKQLYVLSEVEDNHTAKQCCTLAKNCGEDGFSVLLTHERVRESKNFPEVRAAFDHIIFLPDSSTYVVETLRWIICGFNSPGYIGVDYDDARYILAQSKESYCQQMKYEDIATLKNRFMDFLKQVNVNYDKEKEAINHLLGLWTSFGNFNLNDVMELVEKIEAFSLGEVMMTCLPPEKENDTYWTVSLLSAVAKKRSDRKEKSME